MDRPLTDRSVGQMLRIDTTALFDNEKPLGSPTSKPFSQLETEPAATRSNTRELPNRYIYGYERSSTVDPFANPEALRQKYVQQDKAAADNFYIADKIAQLPSSIIAGSSLLRTYNSEYGLGPTNLTQTHNFERGQLANAMRQANAPEINQLARELSPVARALNYSISTREGLAGLTVSGISENQAAKAFALRELRYPSLDADNVARTYQATNDPEIRRTLEQRYANVKTSLEAVQRDQAQSRLFADRMKGTGLGALGLGFAANVVIDETLFKNRDHSVRTIASDAVTPLAVLSTRLPAALKLGLIVGTHVANRYWDSQIEPEKMTRFK